MNLGGWESWAGFKEKDGMNHGDHRDNIEKMIFFSPNLSVFFVISVVQFFDSLEPIMILLYFAEFLIRLSSVLLVSSSVYLR
jgi:hypothetical protein